ncbi:unnamed protein product [Caenorhabditis nigoni]
MSFSCHHFDESTNGRRQMGKMKMGGGEEDDERKKLILRSGGEAMEEEGEEVKEKMAERIRRASVGGLRTNGNEKEIINGEEDDGG